MTRTSWITWRLYAFTFPINLVILVLASDHKVETAKDIYLWSLVACISHIGLVAPVAIVVPLSDRFRNWRFDTGALIFLGAVRGVLINFSADLLNVTFDSSFWYKVFSSTLALPLWFIALSLFLETRRNYQREFQNLFSQAMHKEQLSKEKQNLLPNNDSGIEERILRLQFLTSTLASDIGKLIKRPDSLSDYSREAHKLQSLIDDELRPTSRELWNKAKIPTPKVSLVHIVKMSMLERPLKVITTALILTPYLFFGMLPAVGRGTALYLASSALIFDISLFFIFEKFYSNKWLNRKNTNISYLIAILFIPFFVHYFIDIGVYNYNAPLEIQLWLQAFMFVAFFLILLMLDSNKLISTQRKEVISMLQKYIDGDEFIYEIAQGGGMQRERDFANYLHGEIQAGLTASTLLLHQANKSGDSELAKEALERASALLSQDHSNIAYTRMATPLVKLEKIVAGWKGIAEISIDLPTAEKLDVTVLRNSVQLVEEAIANSIRHAGATEIKVSGILKKDLLTINIFSNGNAMSQGKAGLGTKLFNELSSEWEYASENGQNRITFTLINRID